MEDKGERSPSLLVNFCGSFLIFPLVIIIFKLVDKLGTVRLKRKYFPKNSKSAKLEKHCQTLPHLPDECIVDVLQYLGHDDLLRCRIVCKRWDRLVHSPRLWQHVDFSWIKKKSCFHSVRRHMTEKYIAWVSETAVKVTSLDYEPSRIIDERTSASLARLIASPQCSSLLRSVRFHWIHSWDEVSSAKFDEGFILFLAILTILSEHCKNIINLSIQFNWTRDSVETLATLTSLQDLKLISVPNAHIIQRWHVQKVLGSLPCLRKLTLLVTCMPKDSQKYSITSDSLESLNVSGCVNFHIVEMKLPNLRSFFAQGIRYCDPSKRCLFQMLSEGCPSLTQLNDKSYSKSGLNNFDLSEIDKFNMRMCNCKEHTAQFEMGLIVA